MVSFCMIDFDPLRPGDVPGLSPLATRGACKCPAPVSTSACDAIRCKACGPSNRAELNRQRWRRRRPGKSVVSNPRSLTWNHSALRCYAWFDPGRPNPIGRRRFYCRASCTVHATYPAFGPSIPFAGVYCTGSRNTRDRRKTNGDLRHSGGSCARSRSFPLTTRLEGFGSAATATKHPNDLTPCPLKSDPVVNAGAFFRSTRFPMGRGSASTTQAWLQCC